MAEGSPLIRAGVFQSAGDLGDPAARFAALEAALQGAELDLLLCPELFLSGYNAGQAIRDRAEPVNGPFAARVSGLARRTGTAIAYGFPEPGPSGIYNAAACFGPDGTLLAHRRKRVLPPGFEVEMFVPGDSPLTMFEMAGAKVALVICYEIEFPESARAAARAGADILLVPTAISTTWPLVPEKLVPSRAFENGLWLLYANHAGHENGIDYAGQSCIVAPFGEVVARAAVDSELIMAGIDHSEVERARERLPFLKDLPQLGF
ncbi:MAG: nitrilase-related carbon-nitrogen hydrolase [Minwuia sp.]|uniref:nitrilase-related carbon-nitrogen hydrolase n=1 Tax=Minwuia sp. TaxID=2493630 RepID=UPI003A86F6B5